MAEFGAYLKVEQKLFVRSPLFWLIAIIALLDAWLNVSINRDAVDYGYWIGQTFQYIAPLSILATLIGVQTARRNQALKVDILLECLPFRPVPFLLAQLLIPALWFTLLGMVPAGLLVYFWLTRLNAVSGIGPLVLAVCALQLGMAYLVVIGWGIGRYLNGRAAYLVGFAIWLTIGYLGMLLLNEKLPAILYGLPNIFLFDYRSMGVLDVVWGLRSGQGFWLHQGVYAALTVFFTLLLLLHFVRRRREMYSRARWRGAIGIVAAIALLCVIGYAGVRMQPAAAAAKLEQSLAKQKPVIQGTFARDRPSFLVTDYQLSVRYDGGKLHIVSDMTLGEAQSDPVFTLRDAFAVEKAEADGKPVTWQREGNTLRIHTGGSPVHRIGLTYGGLISDWRVVGPYNNPGRMLVPVRYATESQLYLPGVYGWYPIPGEHRLAQKVTDPFGKPMAIVDTAPEGSPAHYRVTIDYPDTIPLFSNLDLKSLQRQKGRQSAVFEADDARAAVLLGGPLQEVASTGHPDYKFVVSELIEQKAALHIAEVSASALAEARMFFGDTDRVPLLLSIDPVQQVFIIDDGGALRLNAPMFKEKDPSIAKSAIRSYMDGKLSAESRNGFRRMLTTLLSDFITYKTNSQFLLPESSMASWERESIAYFTHHDLADSEQRLHALADWLKQNDTGKPPIDQWFTDSK